MATVVIAGRVARPMIPRSGIKGGFQLWFTCQHAFSLVLQDADARCCFPGAIPDISDFAAISTVFRHPTRLIENRPERIPGCLQTKTLQNVI